MRKMKLFKLNVAETAVRFYIMIAGVIVLGFLDQFVLAAIFGFALALSFILGISFTKSTGGAGSTRKNMITEKRLKEAA